MRDIVMDFVRAASMTSEERLYEIAEAMPRSRRQESRDPAQRAEELLAELETAVSEEDRKTLVDLGRTIKELDDDPSREDPEAAQKRKDFSENVILLSAIVQMLVTLVEKQPILADFPRTAGFAVIISLALWVLKEARR